MGSADGITDCCLSQALYHRQLGRASICALSCFTQKDDRCTLSQQQPMFCLPLMHYLCFVGWPAGTAHSPVFCLVLPVGNYYASALCSRRARAVLIAAAAAITSVCGLSNFWCCGQACPKCWGFYALALAFPSTQRCRDSVSCLVGYACLWILHLLGTCVTAMLREPSQHIAINYSSIRICMDMSCRVPDGASLFPHVCLPRLGLCSVRDKRPSPSLCVDTATALKQS